MYLMEFTEIENVLTKTGTMWHDNRKFFNEHSFFPS